MAEQEQARPRTEPEQQRKPVTDAVAAELSDEQLERVAGGGAQDDCLTDEQLDQVTGGSRQDLDASG